MEFPKSISANMDNVSILLLGTPSRLQPFVYFIFCSVRILLFKTGPLHPANHNSKPNRLYSPILGSGMAPQLVPFSQDIKNQSLSFVVAKAVIIFIAWANSSITLSNRSSRLRLLVIGHLCQGILLNTLKKSPGLLVARCITLPTESYPW